MLTSTKLQVSMEPIYQAKGIVSLRMGADPGSPRIDLNMELHGDWPEDLAQQCSQGLALRIHKLASDFAKEIDAETARVAAKEAAAKGKKPETPVISKGGG